MSTRNQILIVLFFAVYLLILLLTDISLVGFWTDVIISILFSFLSFRLVFRSKTNKSWLTITLRSTAVMLSLVVFGLAILTFRNPFILDTLKLRSFYYQKVGGRIFHAYFKPVGAYSGGEGNFWITESPIFFPIIEETVYYDRTVHHDFNDDNWDGQPTDNYEVVRIYIKEEVIDKGQ